MIDVVHDTQEFFRTILHCMQTGTIKNIEWYRESVATTGKMPLRNVPQCYDDLLDAEVSFHVIGENAAEIEGLFAAYTLSRPTELHKADYLIHPARC